MIEQYNGDVEFESIKEPALKALQSAFYNLVRERREKDGSLLLWEHGQPSYVAAKDIPLPEENLTF